MSSEQMTSGETQRWLERIDKNVDGLREEVRARHHELAGQMTAAIGPVSTLRLRVELSEKAIKDLQKDMRSVLIRSAFLSGALALAGFLLSLLARHG